MFKKQIVKMVSVPHFKYVHDVEYFYRFLSPIEKAKDQRKLETGATELTTAKEPPMVAAVLDLLDGRVGSFICPAVLTNTLIETYPGSSYVGKCFSIIITRAGEGKRYNLCEVAEIADPGTKALIDSAVPIQTAAKSGKK